MQKSIDKIYYAAIYLRLSKEDGDLSSGEKKESNSIANQRKLIEDYLSRNPEITLVQEFCDDGYTGANFDRPDFQRMMEQVKTGKINCIIVKDLSRFGRDYIDSGRYIEKIFPSLGIRFIAINDNYDSAQSQQVGNEIILPFKNLINDSYSRDISIKIRSNLETKRRNGEFVGSHVVYGYRRSDNDKNKLVIDQTVAPVIQSIFSMKMDGFSPAQIADKLNKDGVGGLYRDLREGLISDEDYAQTREVILGEIERLEKQLAELEGTTNRFEEQLRGEKKWAELVKKYHHATEVTAEMVDAMIVSMKMNKDSSLSIEFNHMDEFKAIFDTIDILRKEVA